MNSVANLLATELPLDAETDSGVARNFCQAAPGNFSVAEPFVRNPRPDSPHPFIVCPQLYG